MIFLDNHDVSRIYSELGEDFSKWKQAIAILMTTRGIPCLYYGTEILMSGFTNPDGLVRKDFPGGWPKDSVNKFLERGRSPKEQEAFTYVKKLADFRRAYPVVQTGKLMQFIPDDDVYVYFRYDDKNCVMVAINTSDTIKKLDSKRYAERLNGYIRGFDVSTGGMYSNLDDLSVDAHGVMIWNLRKD
jgi:glycosidase